MTQVVNIRTEKCDVYIGRSKDGRIPAYPERGWCGNPYPEHAHGRTECIRLFKIYFLKRVDTDPEYRAGILTLKGKKLGCFCKPKACHGDVIKAWLDKH